MTSRLFPFIWLTCFAAALMPLAAFEAHFVLYSVTVLAASLSFVILKSDLTQNISPVAVALLVPAFGFWLVAFASVVTSEIPYVSFIFFAFFSVFPLTLCCTMIVRSKEMFFTIAAWGAGIIFAALSLVALLHFFFMPEELMFGRSRWPFADPNSLSGLLTPGFFMALCLMLAGKNRVHSNLGLALAILFMGALLATGSRGGIIGLLAGLFVFSVLALPQLRRHKRCVLILIAAAGLLFFATNYSAPETAESMGHRVSATLKGEVPVLWSRPAIWESTWKIVDAHRWTGTGIGTFFLYYPEVRSEKDPHSAGRMTHSDPLQFWSEMGMLAPIFFYAFIALAVMLTVRALMNLEPGDQRRVRVLAPFCALWAVVLHTHVTFHFYVLSILLIAGLLTGYWFWQVRSVTGDKLAFIPAIKLPGRNALKIILIVPLLAGGFGFMMLQGSHVMLMRGETRLLQNDMEGFVRDVNLASRMAEGKNERAFIMAAKVRLAGLQAQGGIPEPGAEEEYKTGLAQLETAQKLNPRNASVLFYRAEYAHAARLLGIETQDDSEVLLKESLVLDPLYFPARAALAQVYGRRGENQKAFAVLRDGLIWREGANVPTLYYELLSRYSLETDDTSARAIALQALVERMRKTSEKP